jgi:hypothetical protein
MDYHHHQRLALNGPMQNKRGSSLWSSHRCASPLGFSCQLGVMIVLSLRRCCDDMCQQEIAATPTSRDFVFVVSYLP